MRTALYIFLVVLGLFAMIFITNEFEIFGMKFWGTRKENARREIYENSQSYVQGKKQELMKCYSEWNKAKCDEDKVIIESQVRHQFAEFDETKEGNELTPELLAFIKKCKYE